MAQDDDVGTVRTQGALRYSFLEIKEAQRVCGETMTAAALRECGAASFAQQQIFRAHVNDLCATVFAAALRKYNPENKGWGMHAMEEMAPVDEAMATTLKQLEMKVKEEEATVKKLQKHVSRMAVSNTRRELAKARKRHADVLVTYVCREIFADGE
ncbi:hypothetical protein PsorP6_001900 [Peronosclerospora sorghi]|uniref:Uncharacterized protein n=1 Tax=Peronosclerospora sorghi TaxID=230839 RepID=A0ACC0WSY8_9STRA|nr:hypothetical protein PsorP6_001900 [Peronosclerospora sorghi]